MENKINNKNDIVIKMIENDQVYELTYDDFERVETYCENECMGVQFLISANILLSLVNIANELRFDVPYQIEDFNTDQVLKRLEDQQLLKSIENNFGTTDIIKVTKIALKQTYRFIKKT